MLLRSLNSESCDTSHHSRSSGRNGSRIGIRRIQSRVETGFQREHEKHGFRRNRGTLEPGKTHCPTSHRRIRMHWLQSGNADEQGTGKKCLKVLVWGHDRPPALPDLALSGISSRDLFVESLHGVEGVGKVQWFHEEITGWNSTAERSGAIMLDHPDQGSNLKHSRNLATLERMPTIVHFLVFYLRLWQDEIASRLSFRVCVGTGNCRRSVAVTLSRWIMQGCQMWKAIIPLVWMKRNTRDFMFYTNVWIRILLFRVPDWMSLRMPMRSKNCNWTKLGIFETHLATLGMSVSQRHRGKRDACRKEWWILNFSTSGTVLDTKPELVLNFTAENRATRKRPQVALPWTEGNAHVQLWETAETQAESEKGTLQKVRRPRGPVGILAAGTVTAVTKHRGFLDALVTEKSPRIPRWKSEKPWDENFGSAQINFVDVTQWLPDLEFFENLALLGLLAL